MDRTYAPQRVRGGRLVALALGVGVIYGAGWWGHSLAAAPPEPVVDVGLDEVFTIRTKSPGVTKRVRAPEVFAEASTSGRRADARVVQGRLLVDRSTGNVVQVDPGGIRDYYQVVELLTFDKAQKKTDRLLRRIERTGRTDKLDALDARWRAADLERLVGGLRIDAPIEFATFPPTDELGGRVPGGLTLSRDAALLRQLVAGSDELWYEHAVEGDAKAFPTLQRDSQAQRFYHVVDPETGFASPSSVLRERTYRQVLLDRRGGRFATYLPELPTTFEDERAGLVVASDYALRFPKAVARGVRAIKLFDGTKVPFASAAAAFSTSSTRAYTQVEAQRDEASFQVPRVVNTTPPHRERFVDLTTDWEDPDNAFTVPLQARRTLVVRMRWSHPLDPRTTTPANVTLTKVRQSGTLLDEPVPTAINVDLVQRRLGDVTLEITPLANLDPDARYQVDLDGDQVLGLSGRPIGEPVQWWFETR